MNRAPTGQVVARKHSTREGKPTWALGIPAALANELTDGKLEGMLFEVVLVPEGILYRAIGEKAIKPPEDWPV